MSFSTNKNKVSYTQRLFGDEIKQFLIPGRSSLLEQKDSRNLFCHNLFLSPKAFRIDKPMKEDLVYAWPACKGVKILKLKFALYYAVVDVKLKRVWSYFTNIPQKINIFE